MKISLIGSNGFLSSAIGKYAEKRGYSLIMFGRTEPSGHSCDRFIECVLLNNDLDVTGLLDSDMVVYAAGAGIQSNLKEGADVIYHLNVHTPVYLCNRLREAGFRGRLVTFGSYFEMGETPEKRLFTEEDILSADYRVKSDYIVSKRVLTRFVESYCHSFSHWHFILPTIFGPGENPGRLIPYTIGALTDNRTPVLTDGYQTRQYLFVGEIPKVLELSLQNNLPSGIYNIEGKDTLSVREIVSLICQSLGVMVPDDCFGARERYDTGMRYLALDGKKLYSATGFKAAVAVSDVVKDYIVGPEK